MEPLQLLYELDGLPRFELPGELEQLYGGPIGFDTPRLIANFVSTLDGVVAVPSMPGSNRMIAASSAPDRFVMGLLRACSDAVAVIGAGTLAASPTSTWTPARAFPDAAAAYAKLREVRALSPESELVIITAHGGLDVPKDPALAERSLVLTTDAGLERLEGRLPRPRARSHSVQAPGFDPAAIPRGGACARAPQWHEGGPHAIGPMFGKAGSSWTSSFLTLSPLLVGRVGADLRFGLGEGTDLIGAGPVPRGACWGPARRWIHLFLRRVILPPGPDARPPAPTSDRP